MSENLIDVLEGFKCYPTGTTWLSGASWFITGIASGTFSIKTNSTFNRVLEIDPYSSQTSLRHPVAHNTRKSFGFRFSCARIARLSDYRISLLGSISSISVYCDQDNLYLSGPSIGTKSIPLSSPLSNDTYYYLSGVYDSTTNTCKVLLNRNILGEFENIGPIGVISHCALMVSGTTVVSNLKVTDFYCKSGDPWPEVSLLYLPMSSTVSNNWTVVGNSANAVLSSIPYSATQYIEANAVGDLCEVTASELPTNIYQVYGVQQYWRAVKMSGGDGAIVPGLKVGANTFEGASVNVSQGSYSFNRIFYENNPETGNPWTLTDFMGGNVKQLFRRSA